MADYFNKMDWAFMLSQYPSKTEFDIPSYYKVLSPEWPSFLDKYIAVPSMQRLKGIGLLCGTDWTKLYHNRFAYSRFDHSLGVALIVWNFTRDKIQTLAGLFHDISTPVFSHVADFRKGDALTQTITENETELFIKQDKELCRLLAKDGIKTEQVSDYHIYPVADNERPKLSADRLEYMFPSGASLQGSWSLEEINSVYSDIKVLQDENGGPELGFCSVEKAEFYFEKFLETGHVLQLNENKLALQLLAEITSRAIELGVLTEEDCYLKTEAQVMECFDKVKDEKFLCLYKTFRNMTEVLHTEKALKDCFCVSLKVKQRFIDPLVKSGGKTERISKISGKAEAMLKDFLLYEDTLYGCVKLQF